MTSWQRNTTHAQWQNSLSGSEQKFTYPGDPSPTVDSSEHLKKDFLFKKKKKRLTLTGSHLKLLSSSHWWEDWKEVFFLSLSGIFSLSFSPSLFHCPLLLPRSRSQPWPVLGRVPTGQRRQRSRRPLQVPREARGRRGFSAPGHLSFPLVLVSREELAKLTQSPAIAWALVSGLILHLFVLEDLIVPWNTKLCRKRTQA